MRLALEAYELAKPGLKCDRLRTQPSRPPHIIDRHEQRQANRFTISALDRRGLVELP